MIKKRDDIQKEEMFRINREAYEAGRSDGQRVLLREILFKLLKIDEHPKLDIDGGL
jgi:hypothetical protein